MHCAMRRSNNQQRMPFAMRGCFWPSQFPLQQPTRSDFTLWATAIKRISSKFLVLPVPLGKYISPPHRDFIWTTNTDGSSLHLRIMTDGITRYIAYHPTHKTRTRSGTRFTKSNTYCDFPLPYYASVMRSLDKDVQLHSWTDQYIGKPILTLFWDNIQSLDNPSLWRNLRCDGDSTWIYHGLCMGSLIVVHNGSYMKDISTSISAVAVMILCAVTGSICKCTIAEYSESASSYRGKILGAVLTQVILWAAAAGKMGPYLIVTEDCDNNGVVLHGNSPFSPLSSTQTQADVLQIMKRLIAQQHFIKIPLRCSPFWW